MDPRRRAEPEPVEIPLVPGDDRGGRARPPPAGAGTLAPIGPIVAATISRLAGAADAPLGPDVHQRRPWADRRVHRLIRLPPWDAASALATVLAARSGTIPAATPRLPHPRTRCPSARLELATSIEDPTRPTAPRHVGTLHVGRWRTAPVELALDAWSAQRSVLSMRPLRRRGGHLPRRYYDAAHLVMDELWHLIERAGTAC